MTEAEIERMVIRIVGDIKSYERSMDQAAKIAQKTSRTIQMAMKAVQTTATFGFSAVWTAITAPIRMITGVIGSVGGAIVSGLTAPFRLAAKGIESIFSGIGTIIQFALGDLLAGSIRNVIGRVTGLFDKIKTLGSSMSIQMQQAQISFEVMLGSADKAQKMVKQITEFAAWTPMETKDLQEGAKMMMQFGVEADHVMPIMKMLGDVTGGDAQRFGMMTYAFSQMAAAGRLMGQDLMQMVNAGFNPLKEMSRTTGKTLLQLREEMSKGLITYDRVVAAFQSATSAGGSFFGMMQKQSQSMKGLRSTLEDNIAIAAMKIYDSFAGMFRIKDMLQTQIKWIGAFVDSYEHNFEVLRNYVMQYWPSIEASLRNIFGNFWVDFVSGNQRAWSYAWDMAKHYFNLVVGALVNYKENWGTVNKWVADNWTKLWENVRDNVKVAASIIGNVLLAAFKWVGDQVGPVLMNKVLPAISEMFEYLNMRGELARLDFFAWGESDSDSAKALRKSIGIMEDEMFQGLKSSADNLQKLIGDAVTEGFKSPLEGTSKLNLNTAFSRQDFPNFVLQEAKRAEMNFDGAMKGMGKAAEAEAKKAKAALKGTDAALIGSAEARARIMDYANRVQIAKPPAPTPQMLTSEYDTPRATQQKSDPDVVEKLTDLVTIAREYWQKKQNEVYLAQFGFTS